MLRAVFVHTCNFKIQVIGTVHELYAQFHHGSLISVLKEPIRICFLSDV